MRSIIMIRNMNDEACAKAIWQALESSNIDFEIQFDRKIVIIEGNNDKLRLAKQLIENAGFQVL